MENLYFKDRNAKFQKSIDSDVLKSQRECFVVDLRKAKRLAAYSKRRIISNIYTKIPACLLMYCPGLETWPMTQKIEVLSELLSKSLYLSETLQYLDNIIYTCNNPENIQTLVPLLLSFANSE